MNEFVPLWTVMSEGIRRYTTESKTVPMGCEDDPVHEDEDAGFFHKPQTLNDNLK